MPIRSAVIAALLASSCALGQWFTSPRLFENAPGDFRHCGDADGDGDLDVLRFEAGLPPAPWTVFTVMLNDGNGELSPGPSVPLPPGTAFFSLYEDVNGDGRRDVVTVTLPGAPAGIGLDVWPALAGGGFGGAIHVPLPGFVTIIRAGRANADAATDIAVVHLDPGTNSYHVRWVLGSVSNAFVSVPGLALSPTTGVDDIAAVDQDADGIDDIALASANTVSFHTTVAGAPTGPGPTFPIGTSSALSLVSGDVDGDLDADLLARAGTTSTTTLRVLRNQGGGSWALASSQTLTTATAGLHLVDWNGDGACDLLTSGSLGAGLPAFRLFQNAGAGLFTSPALAVGPLPAGGGVAGAFDLDGDQHLDVLEAKALYFGDGSFLHPGATQGLTSNYPPRDWEGDGDVDFVLPAGQVRKNDARGAFTTTSLALPTANLPFSYWPDVVVDDLDGNGLNDILRPYGLLVGSPFPVFQFIEMRRLADNGDGTVTDVGPVASTQMNQISFRHFTDDVDGDSDLDLVNGQGVWINNGSSFLTDPVNPFAPYVPVAKADVDFDNDRDFLGSLPGGSSTIAILRRTTPGAYAVEVLFAPTAGTLNNVPLLADLDDDGDPDIAVDSDATGTAIRIFANTNGTFSEVAPLPFPNEVGPTKLLAGDVDGDGLTDLGVGTLSRLHVFRRTGPGFSYEPARTFLGTDPRAFIDIDNDGDLDPIGGSIFHNRRFSGPSAGFSRQYGVGKPGSGGRTPVLGMPGPIRVGLSPRVTLRENVGGTTGLIALGGLEANYPNFLLPGLTLYVDAIQELLDIAFPGAPGVPGAGQMDVFLAPIAPALAGAHAFLQIGIIDYGATGLISTTNGLEVLIGF